MIKRRIKPELAKAVASGLLSVIILAGLIVLGSRNLSHFDDALVGYTFAVLFAAFAIIYRYAMWLQRPPTALYWKKGEHALGSLRDVAQYSSSLSVDLPALSACAAGSCSGALWSPAGHGRADGSIPSGRASTPSYANPALGEGPLGEEDRNNFHP
jgi:hypothetical protein